MERWRIVFLAAVVLLLAAAVFFFIRSFLFRMLDRRIARFQSELIEKQVREIENMYKQVRGWRHDYRNHIQNMKIQLDQGNYEGLGKYLMELAADLNAVDTVIKTGNVMADAILNSKLSVAEKTNIKCDVTANIPKRLPMTDVELCAIMGNLLDNAVEACAPLPEKERFIRVYIGQFQEQFYLSVQNSAGKVKKSGKTYLSTKAGGENHGYGIFRIDHIVQKYGGYINRQHEPGVFATEIMILL